MAYTVHSNYTQSQDTAKAHHLVENATQRHHFSYTVFSSRSLF